MYKTDAIHVFGNKTQFAQAIGVSKGRISQLPEVLGQAITDRVVGAAVRLGRIHRLPMGYQRQLADVLKISDTPL